MIMNYSTYITYTHYVNILCIHKTFALCPCSAEVCYSSLAPVLYIWQSWVAVGHHRKGTLTVAWLQSGGPL